MMEPPKDLIMTPSCKANLMDSLNYLMEINIQVGRLKNGEITESEFASYMKSRSHEFGYIADPKYTYKVINEVKDL